MGKSGVIDDCGCGGGGGSAVAAGKATELKRELQKIVKAIVAEDEIKENYYYELIDRAHQTLCALKGLVIKQRSFGRNNVDSVAVPEEFRCPLSKELMKDPVIVASGQTYDKAFINKWLKSGNRTCPKTEQVLSHTLLTPNVLIREMISKWCKDNGIQMQVPVQYSEDEGLTEADRQSFTSLLHNLSNSQPSHQKVAAKELRSLTKRIPSFRALFGESPDVIPQLISPLSRSQSFSDVEADLHEDVITTLLNLSIHDNNKKIVAENPDAIRVLIASLQTGTTETRSNAAATLFTLSALDTNKALIGKSGALKPLIELLDEGHPLTIKDVASAIFSLCILQENRTRAVKDGAVRVILKKIQDRVHVDELLAILAILSSNQRAVDEMGEFGAVPCLLSVLREITCPRGKENSIAILYTICYNDRTKWKEMREEEINHRTISQLAENGTSRAKRKAGGILERLNRANILTHTA